MPRDVLTPADLLGRIASLNVACVKCERRGRYRVKTLVRDIGIEGQLAVGPLSLSASIAQAAGSELGSLLSS